MIYEKIMNQLKSFDFTDAQRKKLASIILKLDEEKQDILISGDNIATINGQSLLNGGNISLIKTGIFAIVTELPTNDIDKDKVYLVPSTKTDNENRFSEYIYTDNGWEKLGTFTAEIDLSNYVQHTDVVTDTTNGLMLASDKTKLDGIEERAQVNKIESISVNGTRLKITNKGVNISNATPQQSGLMSAGDKFKFLNAIVFYYRDAGVDTMIPSSSNSNTCYTGSPVLSILGNKIEFKGAKLCTYNSKPYIDCSTSKAVASLLDGLMSKEDKAKLDSQPTIKASDATGVTDNDYVVIKKSELDSILSRLSALENKA